MNIDRSKHNKYTTGAIYGNLTTGGIATDEGGNVTGTGLLYSGNVIYIGGSGGVGSIDPELLSQMLNQDAYSYLNIGDGVYTVNAEARQLKDNINLNIVGDNETTETQVSKDKYLNRTLYDASGLEGGRYSVTYKKVLVIETVNEEPVEVPKWVITIEKISGTPIFTNTDFDGIQILNKDEEVVVYSVDSSKVTVNSSDTTGLISIVIYNDTQIDFTELRIVKSGDYIQDGTYNNIAVIKEIIIQEYITVAITQAGATRFWKLDELGKLYTTYDTYTTKTLGAYGKIWTDYGYTVGNYVQGTSGGAFYIADQLLNTYLEVDKLKVRKKAYFETLEIINVNSVGGKQIISPAGAITLNKVEDKGTYYRCYFLGLQDGVEIENRFKKDDLAFSLNFNIKTPGEYELVANHYFWRKVNAVSSAADANGNHWIDLDKVDCDVDSDIPHVNDVVAQLGNKTDTDRLSAMIFSSVDAESPRIVLCHGINSYSLSSKEYFDLGVNHLTNQAYMNVYGNSFVGARDGSTYVKYTLSEGLTIKGHISASSTYGGQSFSDVFVTTEVLSDSVKAIIGDDLEYLLNQIDGNIESYFYEYSPTLTNYPANTWDTEGDRLRHNGDTFTNIQKYVDDATTPDAGKSWRWVKNASNVWGWVAISDSDAVLALKKAGLALDTADGKRRVFIKKPETTDVYDIGDLWVNATYTDTVGMLVYSNDLLRAKKAKVKGIAFNITDWELASKYTDDTLADQAKQDAATALAAANNAAAEALAAKTRLNSWAEDGTISPTEKLALKAEIVRIDADKSDITGSYTKYGLGTPTSFNTAHANYRAALVDLTKALPENIVIPADFATKLNTYYSERTSALQAVAAKAKLLVDNALSAAEAAQAAATAAGTAANNAQTTINDYKDTIDDIFQDGVITASEKNRLNSLKDTVNTTLFDVLTTYSKVYNNTNLDGKILKTRLKTAYDAFSAAATALLNAVTTILNKVNTLSYAITKGDIATIDNAYINFNTKYTDYVGALGDANLEITNVISNTAYSNAVNKYAWLNGLFDPSQTTTIDGGVVTTGVLALGKTTSGVFKVNAGINGVSNTAYNGGGPAIWFGGDMLDKDNYSAGNRPANVATSMFRFDGSGYLGYKPNADPLKDLAPIWWDTTGNIHANPLSFFVGEETVGLLLASFLVVDSTGDGKVDYVILKAPFTYVLIGNGYIGYDAATNSVYVYVLDSSGNKQICNFYAYGEITAYGESSGGSAPSGALYLDELKDVLFTSLKATQLMQYNGSKWVNIDTSSIITSPTWANITGKPTTVAGYGITDAVVTSDVRLTNARQASDVYAWAKLSTLSAAINNQLTTGTATPSDADYYISQYVGGGTTTVTYHRRTHSALFTYIQGKLPSWSTSASKPVYGWTEITGKPTTFAPSAHTHPISEVTGLQTALDGKSATSHTHTFASLTSKPTTISGYGITDAYIKTDVDNTFLKLSGGTLTNGIEIQNTLNGTSYAWGGGGYNPHYNNIILRGSSSAGSSGILFTSSKGTTGINQPSDRAFIQYHPYGVTLSAEGSLPTIGTTGESGKLVIGVGNDADDMVYIQARSTTGIKHIVGTSIYTMWDSGNFTNLNQLTTRNFNDLQNKPTTLSGYGITDALTTSNYTNYTVTKTGTGASGTWGINISGNASTATTLQTARTINGTSFNGSSNIVTSYWGTARTITLSGNASGSVSINGSGNVTLSVSNNYATNADKLDNYHGALSNAASNYVLRDSDTSIQIGRIKSYSNSSITSTIQFDTNPGNTQYFQCKPLGAGTDSYMSCVILLMPVLTVTNTSSNNFIDGKFYLYKNGGNIYDVVDLSMNQCYNAVEYHISSIGQNGEFSLCRCTYGGINYYAIKVPYHANPYTHGYFIGLCRSDLAGGSTKLDLPLYLSYYNNNTSTATNTEINNSITSTLTTSIVTSVTHRQRRFSTGIIGNSTSATQLQTARTLWGQSFNGTANVSGALSGVTTISASSTITAPTFSGALSGNATTATTLQTTRAINGTNFNGSAAITTALWGTARTIGIVNSNGTGTAVGVSVNGASNVNLKLPSTITATISGNATTATTLQTSRTIWGQSFNGKANVSGALSGATTIDASGVITGSTFKSVSSGITSTFGATNSAYCHMNTTAAAFYFYKVIDVAGISSRGNVNVTGNVVASGEVTAYSDIRLKSNIETLPYRGRLSPKTYIKDGKQSIGFIAQEVQELYPELVLVGEDDNHYLSLNYGSITSVLSAQVNTIEDEVTILKNKIRSLELEITELKNKN